MKARTFLHQLRAHWEWLVLAFVLFSLLLFLLGEDWLGLNAFWSALLGIIGGLLSVGISILMAVLITPLLALITAAIGALVMSVTTLLAFLVGGIFTPLAALFAGWLGTLTAWLATTWLGTLLTPLYTTLAPWLLKIGPLLTATDVGKRLFRWLNQQPWWPPKPFGAKT